VIMNFSGTVGVIINALSTSVHLRRASGSKDAASPS